MMRRSSCFVVLPLADAQVFLLVVSSLLGERIKPNQFRKKQWYRALTSLKIRPWDCYSPKTPFNQKQKVWTRTGGHTNAARHGYYSLITTLNKRHLDKRTLLGRYQMEKESELSVAQGGDPSPQESVLIRDTVRTLIYLGSSDAYLIGLKSVVKRGKLHPVISERVKLAAHIRENLKVLGLKRVARTLSLHDILAQPEDDEHEAAAPNGKDTEPI